MATRLEPLDAYKDLDGNPVWIFDAKDDSIEGLFFIMVTPFDDKDYLVMLCAVDDLPCDFRELKIQHIPRYTNKVMRTKEDIENLINYCRSGIRTEIAFKRYVPTI